MSMIETQVAKKTKPEPLETAPKPKVATEDVLSDPLAQLDKPQAKGLSDPLQEDPTSKSPSGSSTDDILEKRAKKPSSGKKIEDEDGLVDLSKRSALIKDIPTDRMKLYKSMGLTDEDLSAIAIYASSEGHALAGMSRDRKPVSKEEQKMLDRARHALDKLAPLFAGGSDGAEEATTTAPDTTDVKPEQSGVVRLVHPFTYSANLSALAGLHGQGGGLDKGFLSPSAPPPDPSHLLGFQGIKDGLPVLSIGHAPHDNETVYTPPIPMKVHSIPQTVGPDGEGVVTAKGEGLTVRVGAASAIEDTASVEASSPLVQEIDKALEELGIDGDEQASQPDVAKKEPTEAGSSGLVTLEHFYGFSSNREALAGLHGQGKGVVETGFMSSGIAPEASRLLRFRGTEGGFPVATAASAPQDGELVYAPPIPVTLKMNKNGGDGNGVLARIASDDATPKTKKGGGGTQASAESTGGPSIDATEGGKLDRNDPVAIAMRKRAMGH
jgi:hypothetical protein